MKRMISLILALVLVLTLAPAVRADVMWDPIDYAIRSIDLKTVLAVVGLVALVSAVFLWITRKKK